MTGQNDIGDREAAGVFPRTAMAMCFLSAAWVLCFPGAVAAGCQSAVLVVEAEGTAAIINGDMPSARDQAIIDARVKAVETACGVKISARTILAQESMVEHSVVNRTDGFVRSYQLQKEWTEGGQYHAAISAVVSGELRDNSSEKYYRRFSTVVWLEETIDGRKGSAAYTANWLSSLLRNEGYAVESAESLDRITGGRRTLRSAARQEGKGIKELSGKFLARVLVLGKAETFFSSETGAQTYAAFGPGSNICYRTVLTVKVIDAAANKTMLSFSSPADGIKGFGRTKRAAAADSVQAALEELKKQLLPALAAYTGNSGRSITVVAENVPDKDAYDRLKAMLANCRWVAGVTAQEFRSGADAKFVLSYPEQTYILVSALEQKDRRLQVRRFDWDSVAISWDKE